MREIKFRAWHTSGKLMYQNVLTGVRDGEQQYWAWLKDPLKNEHLEWIGNCCEIMQYTGLKDKNGKEIYEGDIVSSVKWIAQVIYGTYSWTITPNPTNQRNEVVLVNLNTILEVIGNIYENPKLLKES